MARRRSVVRDDRAELAEIEDFYRRRLTAPVDLSDLRWPPVRVGPSWQMDGRFWRLPERTLGWGRLAWCGRWLQLRRGEPWVFTDEQARFILHWDSLEEDGSFTYRDGVLQRLKGWGKDPVGACLCTSELLGDVVLVDFDGDRPVAAEDETAWVQTAAVSLEQTKNTMRLLPGLITEEAKSRWGVRIGKEFVYACGDERMFQAVTSSPTTLEGARARFVLPNETQHWTASNAGHDMADVLERNATKSVGGTARTLRITNAPEPGEDSVAERDREMWESVQAGTAPDTGLLYDSLEAHPDAPLHADGGDEQQTRIVIAEVIETVRGDSAWLSTSRIADSILDPRNPASRSRRFWYNQTVAAEDAWADPEQWDALAAADQVVLPNEPIVAFFDGSKSDDATGLIGCRMSDGHRFTLGAWTPSRERPVVPRGEVDDAVIAMFEAYKVRGFFADPSDTRDDDGERFWEPLVDDWHQRYGRQLDVWAVRAGDSRQSIAWDMRSPEHQKEFTAAAERTVAEMADRRFTHDGSRLLRQHVLNARRRPNRWGVSFGKEHRESRRKVDLAVCMVGAGMVRRLVLNRDATAKPSGGAMWGRRR